MKRGLCYTIVFAATLSLGVASPVTHNGWTTAAAWTKAQWREARRKCRKAYGKRLTQTKISQNGTIICHYKIGSPKTMTWDEANRVCKKTYKGSAATIAVKRKGQWMCKYWD